MIKIKNLCLFFLLFIVPFSFANDKQSKSANAYSLMLRTLYKNNEKIKGKIDVVATQKEKDFLLKEDENDETQKKIALDLFKKLSENSLKQLVETLGPLTEKEQELKEKIAALKFNFKHESSLPSLQHNTLYSYYQMQQPGLNIKNTKSEIGVRDIQTIGHHDFTFFYLIPEPSGGFCPHYGDGKIYYIFDGKGEEFTDFGFGTYYNQVTGHPRSFCASHRCLPGKNKISGEAGDFLISNRCHFFRCMHKHDMFTYEDLTKSLPYMLIGCLRELKSIGDKEKSEGRLYGYNGYSTTPDACASEIIDYIFKPTTTGVRLHEVISTFLTIEFHVPHSVPINEHCEINTSYNGSYRLI